MTTQAITDYLTKQIFIEKNVVTYRSLSRHFSLHVNVAKNELAIYHHDAPYQSQTCLATFLISGTPRKLLKYRSQNEDGDNEDIDMDDTQPSNIEGEEDEGEEVPQTKITIVNEKDLEDAKASYDDIFSIHVYSLSPASLHDVDLICEPTYFVRSTDKSKAPEFASTVGRQVGRGVKMGPPRKKALPAPMAGPSNLKRPAALEAKQAVKAEAKEKPTAASVAEKPKPTGKISFFKKVEKPKETKEVKKDAKQIKEEPVEEKKRMFFQKAPLKSASGAPSPAPSVASTKGEKEQPPRGVKRKSSVRLESKKKSPERHPASQAESNARVKRRAIVSDDESDAPSTKAPRRKARPNLKVERAENSEAEREAMAIMDLDDDQVEKVSHVPSTNASLNEHEENDDASSPAQDEDVEMEVDEPAELKVTRKRKPKTVVPVGRNGLKKVRIQKSRKVRDANGYMVTEDYTDWESVNEGAEPPAPKTKAKVKAKAKATEVKKEEEETPPVPEKEKDTVPMKAATKSASAAVKAKSAAKRGNAKTQKGLMNFFGPKAAS